MSFQANHITYEYQQSFAEENLWLVRSLVYVDDVMLFGTREIVEGGLQSFRKTWETSVRGRRRTCSVLWYGVESDRAGRLLCQSMFLLEGSGSETWYGGPLQCSNDERLSGT